MSSFDLALSSPMYVASLPPFSSPHEPPLEHVLRGLAIIADDNLTQDEMLLKIKKLSSPPHDQSPPGNAAAEPSRSLSPPPVKKHRRQPAAPTPVVEGPSRNLRCSTCKPTQPPGCFALAGSSKVVEEVKCGWSTFRQSLSNLLLLYTLCDEEDHIPWRRGAIVGQGCPGERSFSVSFSGFLFRVLPNEVLKRVTVARCESWPYAKCSTEITSWWHFFFLHQYYCYARALSAAVRLLPDTSGFFRTLPPSGYPGASFHPSGRVSRTSDPRPLYMLMHPA
ncbi:hypothetical protein C8R45DRAFT_920226 [Mycena sanguinolenta]|nr:hypothetical protein C8R45DRAFT_920226 [Mycena sanguinolenta]